MLNAVDMMYLNIMSRLVLAKEAVKKKVHDYWEEERGGTATIVIEIVMIGMILVLGFVFRKQIAKLFTDLWNSLVQFKEKTTDPTVGSMENPFS